MNMLGDQKPPPSMAPAFPTFMRAAFCRDNPSCEGLYALDGQGYPLYVFGLVKVPGKWTRIARAQKITRSYNWGTGSKFLKEFPPDDALQALYNYRRREGFRNLFKVGWILEDFATGEVLEFQEEKGPHAKAGQVTFPTKEGTWFLFHYHGKDGPRFTILLRTPDGQTISVVEARKSFGTAIHGSGIWGDIIVVNPAYIRSLRMFELLVFWMLIMIDTEIPDSLSGWIPTE
ncbi:hypothetical protein BC832DRAFT_387901 [Gaertneriomyces semiglobifer]|nr:hypothetical protein BC832DRAFT_387901 [Gaertneriomyces semiglobifer]